MGYVLLGLDMRFLGGNREKKIKTTTKAIDTVASLQPSAERGRLPAWLFFGTRERVPFRRLGWVGKNLEEWKDNCVVAGVVFSSPPLHSARWVGSRFC
jgi:hypothetical protein